jgi:hypothetical protein
MAVATLGVTFDYQLVVLDDMLLTASASLGWRRAFAASPDASLALSGGLPIAVTGNAASSDVAAFAAGLNLDLSDTSALDLRYHGQIGSHSQTPRPGGQLDDKVLGGRRGRNHLRVLHCRQRSVRAAVKHAAPNRCLQRSTHLLCAGL